MIIFASAEDDSNWQGIFQLNFQMIFDKVINIHSILIKLNLKYLSFFVGYIDLLSDAKVQRAILAFVGEMDGAKLNKFNSLLDSHNKNAMFYMARTTTSNSLEHERGNYHMIWDQVTIC